MRRPDDVVDTADSATLSERRTAGAGVGPAAGGDEAAAAGTLAGTGVDVAGSAAAVGRVGAADALVALEGCDACAAGCRGLRGCDVDASDVALGRVWARGGCVPERPSAARALPCAGRVVTLFRVAVLLTGRDAGCCWCDAGAASEKERPRLALSSDGGGGSLTGGVSAWFSERGADVCGTKKSAGWSAWRMLYVVSRYDGR